MMLRQKTQFTQRTQFAEDMVNILDEEVWKDLSNHIYHVPFGYESHVLARLPENQRRKFQGRMRYLRTETARFVRYAPDFFVLDTRSPDTLYLLEYKASRTPRYKIQDTIQYEQKAVSQGRPGFTWRDIGQWEKDAFLNYVGLQQKLNVRVVMIYYCSYHSRPLTADFVEKTLDALLDAQTPFMSTGSGTPYVNFDTRVLRSFEEFMLNTHKLQNQEKAKLREGINRAVRRLQEKYPTKHNPNSPLDPRNLVRYKQIAKQVWIKQYGGSPASLHYYQSIQDA